MAPNPNFWRELARPLAVLAPMAGVTDAAFRRIIAKYGKPDVTWTEFVSADGLCSKGRAAILPDLWFTEAERPIVAQLHSGQPDNMRAAARQIVEMGFDGIDINMGCPAKEVERHLAGAALIRHPDLALEVLAAAQDGAGALPVSVKTRIGYSSNEAQTWLARLIAARPAALTIHARTRDEMSRVPAQWEVVRHAAAMARELIPDAAERPLILGNGDIESLVQAHALAQQTGADGVMIGRVIFGNPWLFSREIDRSDLTLEQVLEVMLEHTRLFLELYGYKRPFEMMKKHYKAYCGGFRGAAEVRLRMMDSNNYAEVEAIVAEVVRQYGDRPALPS